MKQLILTIVLLLGCFHISSFIWSSKGQAPSPIFIRLLEPPQHRPLDPYENGYFYLIGFAATPALDPVKVGHEIWLETNAAPTLKRFDYDKPGRLDLQIRVPVEQVLPSWNSENPLNGFRNSNGTVRPLTGRDQMLVMRYERWLSMPFEDMGFGHRAIPRFVEVFVGHRLFIADGFSRQTAMGMQRLKKDVQMWRTVLRDATTIATKVMAQVVITDDLRLLSTLLSQTRVDKTMLDMTPSIASPLTTVEASLRWPLQHQFTLGIQADGLMTDRQSDPLDDNEQWLVSMSHLPEQAFRHITHVRARSFLGIPLQTRETWEMYATLYDAMIHAAEVGQVSLPKIHELTGTARQGFVESLISPTPFEPDWDPFHFQLKETDARLRLASLQVVLRRPSAQTTVPNRLAEVGSAYYDPFSGLPMLWSPTQKKIYSVGKDRFDDGGDAGFDVSVPAMVSMTSVKKESRASTPTSRTTRRSSGSGV